MFSSAREPLRYLSVCSGIEAAPDLLAALEAMVSIAQTRWRPLPADSHEKKSIAAARAAIAKARG